jgi:secondary thiamine-phosphate synthase enzyme
MKTLSVKTSSHDQMIDITRDIRTAVAELGIEDGTVTIYTPHTTCGLTINENADPDVVHDFLKQLELMVPWRQPFYKHMEGNSAAHVKASMMGFALSVNVEEGI